jgi:hypothetical protein
MPFTAAHPAIVIPLKQRWPNYFSLTGLAMGSMAPDFEYFIKFDTIRGIGHTFAGMFIFDLPLALIAAMLFWLVVRKPLILSLPVQLGGKVEKLLDMRWGIKTIHDLRSFTISALAGMTGHFFLDSFTHHGAFFVRLIPLLEKNMFFVKLGRWPQEVPLHNLVHLAFTVAGLAAIAGYFLLSGKYAGSIRRRMPVVFKAAYWMLIMLSGLAGAWFHAQHVGNMLYYDLLQVSGVSFLSGVIIGTIVISLAYKALGLTGARASAPR